MNCNVTSMTLSILAAAAPAVAQSKLGPRSFLPHDYNVAAYVNLLELQDNGVWGTVERSPAKMLFAMFRRNFGFDLAELERFDFAGRMLGRVPEDGEEGGSAVLVLRGTDKVGTGGVNLEALGGYDRQEIGGHEVVAGREPSFFSPQPGLLVIGDSHLVHPIIAGERRAGVATPELEALIAGPAPLAYFAVSFDEGQNYHALPGARSWLDPEDEPVRLLARLRTDGERGHLALAARIDFLAGDGGAQKLKAVLEGGIEELLAMPALKFAKPLLSGVKLSCEEGSLHAEADLGAPAGAAGLVTQLIVALVMDSGPPAAVAPARDGRVDK